MKKDKLKEHKYNRELIREKVEYIKELNSTVDSISYPVLNISRGTNIARDNMAEKIAKVMDEINETIERISRMQEEQNEIEENIMKVEQPYKLILEKVYVQGKTLVTVAEEMNYSYRQIIRKHEIALQKFENVQN